MIDYAGRTYITRRIPVAAQPGLAFYAGQPAIYRERSHRTSGELPVPEVDRGCGMRGERFAGVFAYTSLAAVSEKEAMKNAHPLAESRVPVILVGHGIIPTDQYDVTCLYHEGDLLYADASACWTTRKREEEIRPFGSVFYPPTKEYPFLTVEFQTPILRAYSW